MGKTLSTTLTAIKKDVYFLLLSTAIFLAANTLLRCLLLWYNRQLATEIPGETLFISFLMGLRFDLMVTAYVILPLTPFMLLPSGLRSRTWAKRWLGLSALIMIFLGVLELDFYKEFHTRLNSLVFEYIKEDPATVGKMIWAGFPVIRHILVVVGLWIGYIWLIGKADTLTRVTHGERKTPFNLETLLTRTVSTVVILTIAVVAARGSYKPGPPLRWGDSIHSEYTFANHLGLNGTFTLIKAASALEHSSQSSQWRKSLPADQALSITREMVLTSHDRLLDSDQPLLRKHTTNHSYPVGRLKNVVFIIMESFAGKFVGALGDSHGITPEFDRLASQGLLFRRFFANGTHTHQGMFASVACFPNLPGHEYLMQQPEGDHHFSGLPSLFPQAGDNNVYVYNGDFRWDNQEGFFRNQGMDNFIGRDDIKNPEFMDEVWGASDNDMFIQASAVLDKLEAQGPFYAVIQTLSNHTPFSLPDPLPVDKITGQGELSDHLTAMRYADWALGQFFRDIQHKPYFDETLFVLVGDHGFSGHQILSAVDLTRFHVPLLFLAPGIQQSFGAVNDIITSQVDMVPTALSLLRPDFDHQCWGRDVLSLNEAQGFAVIKPSGSDQTTAIIEGNKVLTFSLETAPELGELVFTPTLSWKKTAADNQAKSMEMHLKSYIQTALNALYDGKVGNKTALNP